MSSYLKFSVCGGICSDCPRYIATETNDIRELEKIAELWYRLGFWDKILSPEELKCTGCNRDKFCSHNINKCEYLDGINNCGECGSFPCDKVNSVFQKTENADEACRDKCSDSEYNSLSKAFLMKRQILTDINENYKRSKQNRKAL